MKETQGISFSESDSLPRSCKQKQPEYPSASGSGEVVKEGRKGRLSIVRAGSQQGLKPWPFARARPALIGKGEIFPDRHAFSADSRLNNDFHRRFIVMNQGIESL